MNYLTVKDNRAMINGYLLSGFRDVRLRESPQRPDVVILELELARDQLTIYVEPTSLKDEKEPQP
jgi:hypothetical protein